MYYSGTFFGRTPHSAFTARLVVSDLYPVIFATLLEDHPPFVVKCSLDKKYWPLKEGSIVLPLAIS